ncbi:RHS repeat domain-containing protein, partial [Leptospira alstonii]|uniref:RHS repeat domain-containing protein n=1 Tax=Leptospira alstonii TaxID=28452 RepID=UPI000ADD4F96
TGGGSVGGMPVTGMYFFHPDHLGSVQMITDGAGNPASGPEPGVSYVSYEPYGSINRNDSYGPDIFRYKFTGQIEDKDTGLYYYKSRYYEPILGRFLQADSVVMPTNVNGMNRYMYVDGNPISYRDPSGHVSGPGMMHMLNRIVGHAIGKDFGPKGLDKRLSTSGISKGVNRFVHNATFVSKKRISSLFNPGKYLYPSMRRLVPSGKKKEGIGKLRDSIFEIFVARVLILDYEHQTMSEEERQLFLLFYIGAPAIVDSQFNAQTLALFGTKFHPKF